MGQGHCPTPHVGHHCGNPRHEPRRLGRRRGARRRSADTPLPFLRAVEPPATPGAPAKRAALRLGPQRRSTGSVLGTMLGTATHPPAEPPRTSRRGPRADGHDGRASPARDKASTDQGFEGRREWDKAIARRPMSATIVVTRGMSRDAEGGGGEQGAGAPILPYHSFAPSSLPGAWGLLRIERHCGSVRNGEAPAAF